MEHRWRRAAAVGVAALVTAGLVGAASASPGPVERPSAHVWSMSGPATTVTLITGDRVTLDAQGRVTSVRPGYGREGVPISVHTRGHQRYVVPQDAAPLVACGVLDERLFDVTAPAELGYAQTARHALVVSREIFGSA